jgi:hypothetical protein
MEIYGMKRLAIIISGFHAVKIGKERLDKKMR